MEGKRLIHEIKLTNILSYGAGMEPFELQPLNVLIGPNNSGKSNLISAISLLQAAPKDLLDPIREGGGAAEWIWKGGGSDRPAEVGAVVEHAAGVVTYRLAFETRNQRFVLQDEDVTFGAWTRPSATEPHYSYNQGEPTVVDPFLATPVVLGDVSGNRSILSQIPSLRGDLLVAVLPQLHDAFEAIRVYREWDVSRHGELRRAQPADLDESFLDEDGRNLPSVINDLDNRPGAMEPLVARLKRFYEAAEKVTTRVIANSLLLMVHERGLKGPTPATRLSDGTLRYLCLLATLCHPEPPPLVCIEEPEIGLHPDVIPEVAKLLIEASQRTQLIVTTHSDLLVSSLSSVPEAVVVCERDEEGTRLKRSTDIPGFDDWLKDYSLGELWLMGRMGGNP